MFTVQIGSELYDIRSIEGLRCPECGEFIDLTTTSIEGRLWRYTEHVVECLEITSSIFAAWVNGGLELNDQRITDKDMQPITSPESTWSKPVEDIYQHFKDGGFDVELNEEENIVVVTGLTDEERYSIDSSGQIYGHGCLRLNILEWLKKL